MDNGIFNNGLVGALLATVWFFQRYGQLESDYSTITPYAARLRAAALVLAAAAIPIASGLVFVVVIAIMSGPSLLGFDGPTWYVAALWVMLALVIVVELANAIYRVRARAEARMFDPFRPRAGVEADLPPARHDRAGRAGARHAMEGTQALTGRGL